MDCDIIDILNTQFQKAVDELFPDINIKVEFVSCKNEKFGDFTSAIALEIAAKLNQNDNHVSHNKN